MFFEDTIDDSKFSGHLYGLGTSFAVNGSNNYSQDNGENANSSGSIPSSSCFLN